MTIKTKFERGQQVYITELKVPGRVKAFYLADFGGVQYLVRFFRETGDAYSQYFFEDELGDEIPAAKRTGFVKEAS